VQIKQQQHKARDFIGFPPTVAYHTLHHKRHLDFYSTLIAGGGSICVNSIVEIGGYSSVSFQLHTTPYIISSTITINLQYEELLLLCNNIIHVAIDLWFRLEK